MTDFFAMGSIRWAIPFTVLSAFFPQRCGLPWPPDPGPGTGGTGSEAGAAGESSGGTGNEAGSAAGGETSAGAGGEGGATTSCPEDCVLRVDPDAAINGTGASWEDPMNDVQLAIDAVAAQGGGSVWVLGGEFAELTTTGGDLLTLHSGVSLFGGFEGTESAASERSPSAPATVLRGPGVSGTGSLLTLDGASDVLLDGLSLVNGQPSFRIADSTSVTFSDVQITATVWGVGGLFPFDQPLVISDSEVRFESSLIEAPYGEQSFVLEYSDVAFVDSSVSFVVDYENIFGSDYYFFPRLTVTGGRTLFDHSSARLLVELGSVSFAIDSSFLGGPGIQPAVIVENEAAFVDTTITGGIANPPLWAAGHVILFDSSVANEAQLAHGHYPEAWAIEGPGVVDASVTSFIGGRCAAPGGGFCPALLVSSEEYVAGVNNSLFVPAEPILSAGEPMPTPAELASNVPLPASNCIRPALDLGGYFANAILPSPHPCPDGGDAAALEASRVALLSFAAPFLVAPFDADLSTYEDPTWWQDRGVVQDQCTDPGAPDPGRHALVCGE